MAIPHATRPDGTPAVSRAYIDKILGGAIVAARPGRSAEPNWNAMKR